MIALVRHPTSPAGACEVAALAARGGAGHLALRWVVHGAVDAVRVPAPGPLQRGARLWEHTCVEAFIAAADTAGYVELNFSPAPAWAAYGFAAYRAPRPCSATMPTPRIAVRRDAGVLAIDVAVELAALDRAFAAAPLRIGLAAVIEAQDGGLSYWALRHPSAKPDFHHPAGFALRLPPLRDADGAAGRGVRRR